MLISLIDLENNCIVHVDNENDPEKKYPHHLKISGSDVRGLFDLIELFNSIYIYPSLLSFDNEMFCFKGNKFVILDEEVMLNEIEFSFCFKTKKHANVFVSFLDIQKKENVSEKEFENVFNGLAKITDFQILTHSVNLLEDIVLDCCGDCENCENCHNEQDEQDQEPYVCDACKEKEQQQQNSKKLLN